MEYDFYENPQAPGSNPRRVRYHARVVGGETVTTEALLNSMERHNISKAAMLSALEHLKKYLSEQLARGNNVHIKDIGYFSPVLSCPETRHPSEHHAQSIHVGGVAFRPEKKWVAALDRNATFVRATRIEKSVPYTSEQIKAKLTDYLQEHGSITAKWFRHICYLTRYGADKWLQTLVQEGFLQDVGSRTCRVYRLAGK